MTEVISVLPEELFKIKLKAEKEADAVKAAEYILEAYHAGWVKSAGAGGVNLGSSQEGRGDIARKLLAEVPRYDQFPLLSLFLLVEIVRAWVATEDLVKEAVFANSFLFARLHGFPEVLSRELKNTGYKTAEKAYRVFGQLSIVQINHNLSIRILAETLSFARPEHLIAMGKILATGAVDPYFVDFRLPKLLRGLERIAKK